MAILKNRASGIRSFDAHRQVSEAIWQFDWHFPENDPAFSGHFPHQPILPGVFLMEMAQRAAEFALNNAYQGQQFFVHRIESFRFLNSILPGDRCTLQVEWAEAAQGTAALALRASFSKHTGKVAQGQLTAAASSREAAHHAC